MADLPDKLPDDPDSLGALRAELMERLAAAEGDEYTELSRHLDRIDTALQDFGQDVFWEQVSGTPPDELA